MPAKSAVIAGVGLFFLWFQVVSSTYVMNTVAGGGHYWKTTGVPANNSILSGPSGLWKDSAGAIFFTEPRNYCVRKIDVNGLIQNVAGVCGTPGASDDGGQAVNSLLAFPTCVGTNSMGFLYIADFNNFKIRMVIPWDGTIWTVVGNGQDRLDTGLSGTSAAIGKPLGLWVSRFGQVYFSSFTSNQRFLSTLDPDTGNIVAIAGSSSGHYGDGMAATSTSFADIAFLWGNENRRFVFGDGGNDMHGGRVRAISADRVVSTLMGNGQVYTYSGEGTAATSTALQNPNSAAVDESTGDVYVSLYDGQRVVKLTNSTGLVHTFAGNGGSQEGVEGGDATAGAVMSPLQILFDSTKGLYIADSFWSKIRLVHEDLTSPVPTVAPTTAPYVMNTVAGGGSYLLTTGVPAVNSILNNPSGLWKDSSGVIFFTEMRNGCARKIDLSGFIQNVAGTCGASGASGDGGAATLSGLSYPTNIVTDTTGVVYIADFGQYKIRKVLLDGTLWTFAGNGGEGHNAGVQATSVGIGKPLGLWINPDGQVFYSTFTSSTRFLNMITTDGIIVSYAGSTDGAYGDGFAATSTIFADIAFLKGDSSGRLLFGDGNDDIHGGHVRAISVDRVVSTVFGNGVKAYSGEGTQATATSLMNPNGVAIDESTGDVFVSLYDGQRVQKLTISTGLVHTFAGTGQVVEGVEGGAATSSGVAAPYAMLFDSNGLYVVDGYFSKIRLVHHPYPSGQPTPVPNAYPVGSPSIHPINSAYPNVSPSVYPSNVVPTSGAGPTCYWSEEEDSCGGDLQEVVVSSSTTNGDPSSGSSVTTSITRTYRKRS